MNPIEFGTNLFAKAREIQTKTVRACEVIAKIDEELSTMPDPFKMDLMCLVTKAVDKCENMNNKEAVVKVGQWEWVKYDYPSVLGNWVCSVCKSVVVECVGKDMKRKIPTYKYCPNCGAKIQEVKI